MTRYWIERFGKLLRRFFLQKFSIIHEHGLFKFANLVKKICNVKVTGEIFNCVRRSNYETRWKKELSGEINGQWKWISTRTYRNVKNYTMSLNFYNTRRYVSATDLAKCRWNGNIRISKNKIKRETQFSYFEISYPFLSLLSECHRYYKYM